MNPCFIDLTGRIYGSLKVISIGSRRDTGRSAYWNVMCECGNVKEVRGSNLKSQKVKSCGKCLDTYKQNQKKQN